ncbi:hypothetical protein [Thalassovita mangrovi]|uniref:Uncharacterized protein n=1 Tax=Thalassovita mangrovi TaxID=2692236 RepID=A0A6L8LHH6_9RHOB|nr:hypothetical protein [Thalassovita mangrovi]MYM55511.1 hypothetical protein [Thalassovita mangrovi]
MSRKFIATVLAASLAVTSISAAPARAGEDDLVKLLAGATALFIIGKAINDKPARAAAPQSRNYDYTRPEYTRPYDGDRRHEYQHRQRHAYNAPLPGYCRSSVWTDQGRQRFLDGRCLRQNYSQARDLPQQCRITVGKGADHKRRGYSIPCLKRNGFEIARN